MTRTWTCECGAKKIFAATGRGARALITHQMIAAAHEGWQKPHRDDNHRVRLMAHCPNYPAEAAKKF